MENVILIVEDNTDNSLLVSKILEHAKYQTKVVETGKETLEYCATTTPALILLDISLPDMDGFEVAKALREQEATKNTPIIAITAHVMEGIEEESKKAGCNEYVAKPFMPKDLVALVGKYIQPQA